MFVRWDKNRVVENFPDPQNVNITGSGITLPVIVGNFPDVQDVKTKVRGIDLLLSYQALFISENINDYSYLQNEIDLTNLLAEQTNFDAWANQSGVILDTSGLTQGGIALIDFFIQRVKENLLQFGDRNISCQFWDTTSNTQIGSNIGIANFTLDSGANDYPHLRIRIMTYLRPNRQLRYVINFGYFSKSIKAYLFGLV